MFGFEEGGKLIGFSREIFWMDQDLGGRCACLANPKEARMMTMMAQRARRGVVGKGNKGSLVRAGRSPGDEAAGTRRVSRYAPNNNTGRTRVPLTVVARSGEDPEPSTTKEEEAPLWVRREQEKELREKNQEGKLPFGVYLLASAIIAIAAVRHDARNPTLSSARQSSAFRLLTLSPPPSRHIFFDRAPFSLSLPSDQIASIFEYTYQNPIFSVVPPTSFLYKPILGIFVFTGLPLSAYLFYEAIKSANELSESMDKQDGV